MTAILNEYRVLRTLPEVIKNKIKCLWVSSEFVGMGICITTDDMVYGMGEHFQRLFAYNKVNDGKHYLLISELCGKNIEDFYCYSTHFMFAKSINNQIFGWGVNTHGQLLRGYVSQNFEHLRPQQINFFDDKNIVDISCGYFHCLALASNGTVFAWGSNCSAQFFEQLKELENILIPFKLDDKYGINYPIKYIHCYAHTSYLVTNEGLVYILNPNRSYIEYDFSKLTHVQKIIETRQGIAMLTEQGNFELFPNYNALGKKVNKLSIANVIDIETDRYDLIIQGQDIIFQVDYHLNVELKNYQNIFEYYLLEKQSTHKAIHLRNNEIFVNDIIKIKDNLSEKTLLCTAKQIIYSDVQEYFAKHPATHDSDSSVKRFQIHNYLPENLDSNVNYYHMKGSYNSKAFSGFYVMNDDRVYAIGSNGGGVLGLGHEDKVDNYSLIEELSNQKIEQFFNGRGWMFARNKNNEIFGWGKNMGLYAKDIAQLKPRKIEYFNEKSICHISAGSFHFMALSLDGLVYSWGRNNNGQVGCGDIDYYEQPTLITLVSNSDQKFKYITAEDDASFAVTIEGRVYCWGQFQLNAKTMEFISFRVPHLLDCENVCKINYHICSLFVLDNNGHLFKFSDLNEKQQLKLNNVKYTDLVPVLIFPIDIVLMADYKSERGDEKKIYELTMNRYQIKETDYTNFYDYFVDKHQLIKGTVQISSNGYLMRKHIELNVDYDGSPGSNILTIEDKNIFDYKFENSFIEVKEIGTGTFGTVFKVESKIERGHFAIKRVYIKNDLISTLKEIQIMSKLNSDYTVNHINSWIEKKVVRKRVLDFMYIQMEFCAQNLQNVIDNLDALDETFKYFICSELLLELIQCLNYLHSQTPPIIHRDLKTANILVTDGHNGRFLKLCDFGLAKVVSNSRNSLGIGTLKYMAPEMVDPIKSEQININCYLKSDIYSLGIVVTEIFQINEFSGLNERNKYLAKISNMKLKSKFSKLMDNISSMLSLNPEDRPDIQEILKNKYQWSLDIGFIENHFESENHVLLHLDYNFFKIFFKAKLSMYRWVQKTMLNS